MDLNTVKLNNTVKEKKGAGEMALWFRALAALIENLSLAPSATW